MPWAVIDFREVTVQLVFGIGAIGATLVAISAGLLRRRSLWLYLAALLILGPSFYVAGSPSTLRILGIASPLLCLASAVAMTKGQRTWAAALLTPVFTMIVFLLVLYGYGLTDG